MMPAPDRGTKATGKSARRALIVLGMYRSGTSALTGLIEAMGCDGPATPLHASITNQTGHHESAPILQLHDEILAATGSAWHDYRPFPEEWLESAPAGGFRRRLRGLIDSEYGRSDLFVVKDPRLCRFLPLWTRLFDDMDIQPMVVHIHRNPLEVSRSLNARNKFDLAYGQLLWLRHVLSAEAASRDLPRVFASYDRLVADWSGVARKVQEGLGLSWPPRSGKDPGEVISSELKHYQFSTDQVLQNPLMSRWIRDTYAILEDWAALKEKPKNRKKLDRIRDAFDASSMIFGNMVQRQDNVLLKERDDARARLAETELWLAERTEAVDTLAAERDALRMDLSHTRNMLAQRRTEIDDIQSELVSMNARLIDAQAEVQSKAVAHAGISAVTGRNSDPHSAIRSDLAEYVARLEQHSDEAVETRVELDVTRRALSEVERWRSEIHAELTEYKLAAKRLRAENLQQQSQIIEQSARLAEVQSESDVMRDSLRKVETKLAKKDRAVKSLKEKLQAHLSSAESFRSDIYRSTSWRLTRPVRWIARRLKGRYHAGG